MPNKSTNSNDNASIGIWKADFNKRVIVGFGQFVQIIKASDNKLSFDTFFQKIPENKRENFQLKFNNIAKGNDFDISIEFQSDIDSTQIQLLEYDKSTATAWGSICKCKNQTIYDEIVLSNNTESLLRLIRDDISNDTIYKILNEVLKFTKSNRVSIIFYNKTELTQTCTHEVCSQGITLRQHILNNIPQSVTAWLTQNMYSGMPIKIDDWSKIPEEAEGTNDVLFGLDVKSAMYCPIIFKSQTIGYVCIEYIDRLHTFSAIESQYIKNAGNIIAFILNHIDLSLKYNAEVEHLVSIRKNMPLAYLRVQLIYELGKPIDYKYLEVNEAYETLASIKHEDYEGQLASQLIPEDYKTFLALYAETAKNGDVTKFQKYIQLYNKILNFVLFNPNYNEVTCLIVDTTQWQNMGNFSDDEESTVKLFVHSIRTQLNAILGFSELMAETAEIEDRKKYIDIIKENSDKLLEMASIMDIDTNNETQTEIQKKNIMEDTEVKKKPTILVAEDTESNYILVSYILKNEYEVIWARDGVEAIEKYESIHPDLILMDVRMPRLGGLAATCHIRETDKEIPIIALTAFAFDSDKVKTLEAGCTDFLSKPIQAATLRKTVQKYL